MTEGLHLSLHVEPDPQAAPEALLPVAQYVRMSTEHQKYSTDNQAQVIAAYAEVHKMRVVRTYMDAGKSGLNLRGRPGLQQLLGDVCDPHPGFSAVLVYDISRWGRFPDPDEAAVYEQTCKRRGIRIIYCAEQFKNDGSLSSTVMVGLKRSMAAEYSRELSVKVFAGHRNLVQRGYRQGAPAGYGLRRQLVDEHHNVKGLLARGEQKSIQTDRVLLVPGPDAEIATVHEIYRMFTEGAKAETAIAAALNERGLKTDRNRPWTRATVHEVLTNEKYIGNNVYNRKSFKLKVERRQNPPTEWVRKDGAFAAVVPEDLFRQAQAIIAQRSRHLDDDAMLALLRPVLEKHGDLSHALINDEDGLPSSISYQRRFGSLNRVYGLIGFRPKRDLAFLEINQRLREYHPAVMQHVTRGISEAGGCVQVDTTTDLLRVNNEFTVSVVVARCKEAPNGSLQWSMHLDSSVVPDVTIVARMDRANLHPLDFYVLPSLDFGTVHLPVKEANGLGLDFYRVDALDDFFALCARSTYTEAA